MFVKIKCAVLLNSQDDCDVEMKYYTSLYYSDWHTECSINSTYGFSFPHLQLSDYTGLCVHLSLLSQFPHLWVSVHFSGFQSASLCLLCLHSMKGSMLRQEEEVK